ncbi:hypothetical protein SCHPADRAFT_970600 [Schizopora paradoxa]|uniref:Uncharacterized protein n=1 Tax=Schizopora paradoxa TaxID=27342 RepID=A0A0H2RU61_9AGAM|nr:hypothetical protein SCHPADRAFT_970600 [Schizopora paradoxa]
MYSYIASSEYLTRRRCGILRATTRDDTSGCPTTNSPSASVDSAKSRISCVVDGDGNGTTVRGAVSLDIVELSKLEKNLHLLRPTSSRIRPLRPRIRSSAQGGSLVRLNDMACENDEGQRLRKNYSTLGPPSLPKY